MTKTKVTFASKTRANLGASTWLEVATAMRQRCQQVYGTLQQAYGVWDERRAAQSGL